MGERAMRAARGEQAENARSLDRPRSTSRTDMASELATSLSACLADSQRGALFGGTTGSVGWEIDESTGAPTRMCINAYLGGGYQYKHGGGSGGGFYRWQHHMGVSQQHSSVKWHERLAAPISTQ